MKIKILIVLFAVCLLLCSCGNNQQNQNTTNDITTTTTEETEVTTTESNDVQDTQDDSDDIPSLFVTTEPETTVNMDNLFDDVFGDFSGGIDLPVDEWEDDMSPPVVVVTTAPPSQEPSDTHETTTEAPTEFDDSNILPEDVWDDEE